MSAQAGAARLGATLALLLIGCADGQRADTGGARLEMEWTGESKGHLAGPATAEWCDSLKVLLIRALSGDSGVAIALYPTDTVRSDSYPVVTPAKADSVPPAAAVAFRFFAQTSVKGYQGDSGRVLVRDTTGGRLSGRFSASLKSATDGSRLRAGGTFRDVRVVPASRGCVARRARTPADTGITAHPPADTGVHLRPWKAPISAGDSGSRPRSKAGSPRTTTAR
jgi:hypothetical protein